MIHGGRSRCLRNDGADSPAASVASSCARRWCASSSTPRPTASPAVSNSRERPAGSLSRTDERRTEASPTGRRPRGPRRASGVSEIGDRPLHLQSDDGVVVRLARRPNVKQVLLKHRQPHSGHASFGPSSITRAHSMHIATMLHCPRASAALLTSSGGSVVATFRLRPNRMGATFRPASRLAELVTRAYRLPSVAVAWEPRISLLFRRLPSSDSDSLRNLRWVGFASPEGARAAESSARLPSTVWSPPPGRPENASNTGHLFRLDLAAEIAQGSPTRSTFHRPRSK